MCKIVAFSNTEKIDLDSNFINIVKSEVCKLSDKDGFGYAVLNKDGSLGGEKTTKPFQYSPFKYPKVSLTARLPIVTPEQTVLKFGKINRQTKAFMAHGRFSTNSVGINNTHPFTNGFSAMIHNGVVDDISDLVKNLQTDCDTELLYKQWLLGGMPNVEKYITGYYAFVVLDQKTGLMHVVRDSRATLYIAYCRYIDSFIIATTKDIIKGIATKMNWRIEEPELINNNTHVIFNKNHIVSHSTIIPLKLEQNVETESRAALALGAKDYNPYDDEIDDAVDFKDLLGSLDADIAKKVVQRLSHQTDHEIDQEVNDYILNNEFRKAE